MFKFNFFGGDEDQPTEDSSNTVIDGAIAKEISHEEEKKVANALIDVTYFGSNNNHSLQKYRVHSQTVEGEENLEGVKAIVQKSDLEPGVYEGGFKLWECAIDLVSFLADSNIECNGKTVLEVGSH